MSGKCDCEEIEKTLKAIFCILNNLKYECESRTYTLDENEMGWVFHCRDLAELVLRGHEK